MADFAGTIAITGYSAPFGGHEGRVNFTITLSSTTYASPVLNLSSIASKMPNIAPSALKNFQFQVGAAAAGYMVSFLKAATPTWANLGDLKLFTATGTEGTGSLTLTIMGSADIFTAPVTLR